MRTSKEFLNELLDRLVSAKERAKESHDIAPDSYGAGYEQGFADALDQIWQAEAPPVATSG